MLIRLARRNSKWCLGEILYWSNINIKAFPLAIPIGVSSWLLYLQINFWTSWTSYKKCIIPFVSGFIIESSETFHVSWLIKGVEIRVMRAVAWLEHVVRLRCVVFLRLLINRGCLVLIMNFTWEPAFHHKFKLVLSQSMISVLCVNSKAILAQWASPWASVL